MDKAKSERKQALPFAVAIGFAVLGGLGLWYFGAPTEEILREESLRDGGTGGTAVSAEEAQRARAIAERYVDAVRAGDCETVVAVTWWMQERLAAVRGRAGESASAVDEAHDLLCAEIREIATREPLLRPEGIEDQHVFTRGAKIDVQNVTGGRRDLAKPASAAVWLDVRYPSPSGAPRDEKGRPVKALRVGVHISADGYVLKAGVRGNLDVDYGSIAYHW